MIIMVAAILDFALISADFSYSQGRIELAPWSDSGLGCRAGEPAALDADINNLSPIPHEANVRAWRIAIFPRCDPIRSPRPHRSATP